MPTPDPADPAALVAEALAVLHANGAGTQRSLARAAQLEPAARVELSWSDVTVQLGSGDIRRQPASPLGIGMNRVMAVDNAIDDLTGGRSNPSQAYGKMVLAAALPPARSWLFALACAVGATCLALIFGVQHWQTVVLIAATSFSGAFLRRAIGGSNLWQAGCAALLAGLAGAVAVHLGLSSSLRLAAVCPCMILVPGPHLLNGILDLAGLRIPLGLARLTYAALTLLAIGAGLLIGLKLGGAGLATEAAGRTVPLWLDAAGAGVVAVCYGIFYSAPLRILVWPFVVGAGVHALRWVALEEWHFEAYAGAGLACLVAGAILVPVSRRLRMPFSAVGFASVVSLIPGVLIFRTFSGLAQLPSDPQLLASTVSDAVNAVLTLLAMGIGFVIPAAVYDRYFA